MRWDGTRERLHGLCTQPRRLRRSAQRQERTASYLQASARFEPRDVSEVTRAQDLLGGKSEGAENF